MQPFSSKHTGRLSISSMGRLAGSVFLVLIQIMFVTVHPVVAIHEADAGQPATKQNKPLFAPVPGVTIVGMPGSIMLGSEFTFTVRFDNTGDQTGYGPYIDLYFPVTGSDGIYPGIDPGGVDDWTYDGIDFVSATYLGSPVTVTQLTFDETLTVSHPYYHTKYTYIDPKTGLPKEKKAPVAVTAPPTFKAGDKLVVLQLPFGSFVTDQPAVDVVVKARLSDLADLDKAFDGALGNPAPIYAGGGFQFGATELDDWCCEVPPSINSGITDTASVSARLLNFSKRNNAAEGETATGPNYPHTYTATIDVAEGQQLLELTATDRLPNNIVYLDGKSYAPDGPGDDVRVLAEPLADGQPHNNSELTINWCLDTTVPPDPAACNNPVVNGTDDASFSFDYYVSYLDADGNHVVEPTGADDNTCNDLDITYSWLPIDPRDGPVTRSDSLSSCTDVSDEALVLRKSASNTSDASNSPGDVIEYRLSFEVSDYFALNNLILTDVLSDGQHFDPSYTPRLSVTQNGGTQTVLLSASNVTSTCDYSGATTGPECYSVTAGGSGSTTLVFSVSEQMKSAPFSEPNGRLIGACVDPTGNPSGPNCAASHGMTTGSVTYRAIIQDEFTDLPPGVDVSVDQGDRINNTAVATADVLDLLTLSVDIGDTTNSSSASLSIATGKLVKSLYAINDTLVDDPENFSITPGDTVTYRLKYNMPTSDVENLFFEDYLPLPVFRVGNPDGDGTPGPAWAVFDTTKSDGSAATGTGKPAPGTAMFGPDDTFFTYSSIIPSISTDIAANKLTFSYGTFDSSSNQSRIVDILFTIVVTSAPYADGLFLTNQAQASESNTVSQGTQNDAIVKIEVTEPAISGIKKAAVSSDNPAATLEQEVEVINGVSNLLPLPPVMFEIPGTIGLPWSGGLITSETLPFDSAITLVDGGDTLRFAIFIENQGSGPKGAFDITIKDTIPAGLHLIPDGPDADAVADLNIQIYNGAGDGPFTFTAVDNGADGIPGTSDDALELFDSGIRVDDPDPLNGACQSHTIGAGKNIIVITYDLQVDPDVVSGQIITNEGELINYANSDGGQNFLEEPLKDDGNSTVGPASIAKTLFKTGIEDGHNSKSQAVIGEYVYYDLRVTVPEGGTQSLKVTENIPANLAYVGYTLIQETVASEGALIADFGGHAAGLPVAVAAETLPVTTTGVQLVLEFDTPADAGANLVVNPPDNQTNPADADPSDDALNDVFIVRMQLAVPNLSTVSSGTDITNSVTLDWTDQKGTAQTTTTTENSLTLIEPQLTITKTSNPASPADIQAHDILTYSVRITNSGSTDAFDVTLRDVLPRNDPANPSTSWLVSLAIDSVTDTAGVVTAADFEIVDDDPVGADGDNNGWVLQTAPAANIDLAVGQEVTVVLHGTTSLAVAPEQTLTNTASVQWTSLDDEDVNDGVDSDERTGEDGVGGALNDYAVQSQVSINIAGTSISKFMLSTSEAHTAEPVAPFQPTNTSRVPVTIGEIVRYRLLVQYPESTTTNFHLTDYIPPGMTFLNDGTAKAAFFSNNGITSSAYAVSGTFTIAGVTDPDCQLDEDLLGSIVDGLTPTIPTTCAPLDTSNVSRFTTSDNDDYKTTTGVTGRDVHFMLGSLVNQDNDPSEPEYIILEFNAIVDNNGSVERNDAGEAIFNRFRVYINDILIPGYSNSVYGQVVEPAITDLAKTATPDSGDAGDTIAYRLTFSNGSGTPANDATAFDVVITDHVPDDMTLDLGSLTVTSACATGVDTSGSGSPTANDVNVKFQSVPVGCSVEITYDATLNATVTADQVMSNTANLTYTSLPGNKGTAPNPTGSTVEDGDGAVNTDESGGAYGERNGTGANPPNDYADSASAQVTANALDLVKSLVGSTNPDTIDPDLAIGEVATYRLATVLPEGTSLAFNVYDTLPAGFTYAGNPRLSFVADSAMTVSADLIGADNDAIPPTFDLEPTGRVAVAGQDVTITLGDLINNDRDNDSAEYVVIEFDVLVNDSADNNNTDLKNNHYTVSINGVSKGPSNDEQVRIVEPFLEIAKSADDVTWLYGQTVEYTLGLSYVTGTGLPANDSNSVAYDIVVTDNIPGGLTFDAVTPLPPGWTQSYSAPNLTLSCLAANGCSFASADSPLNLTFTVTVDSPPAASILHSADTARNNVTMTWTSMPGPSADERTGAGGVDDYNDSAYHDGALEYYSIGNRVWFDTDNDSQIDLPDENVDTSSNKIGVDGVTVKLFKDDGTGNFVDTGLTELTANGGYYLFDYLEGGTYLIVLPQAENFAAGRVLAGYYSSGTTMASDGTRTESVAENSETNPADSDDNGMLQTGATFTGAVVSQPVTLGPTGITEPTGESDLNGGLYGEQPDGRANMTVDFGFYRASLGNQVYYDNNLNGTYDAGTDQALDGVTVRLYVTDGVTTTEVEDTTTDSNGQYIFQDLPAGSYFVTVEGPANTASTVDSSNPADTTTPDANQDHNDNGPGTSGGVTAYVVSSNVMQLVPGSTGALSSNTVTYASGETYNPTLDFGFVHLYNLGNRVWFDTDNSSAINGSEVGAADVTLDLYKFNTTTSAYDYISSDTTGVGGYYLFENLFPGSYVVTVAATNFGTGAVLEGYWSSATSMNADGTTGETAAPSPEDSQDSDDNGAFQSGAVVSLPVTLGPVGDTEPTDDDDLESDVNHGSQPDGRSNLTVDFGFYKTEIGNLVFGDVDKDGEYSAGDTLLDGVTVQLFATDGVTTTEVNIGPDGILGTGDDTTSGVLTGTAANSWANGEYLFSGLPVGSYIVRVVAPAGTASTNDNADSDDTTTTGPDANSDDNDNGQGTGDGTVSAGTLTMSAGETGAQNENIVDDGAGPLTIPYGVTRNPTVDFGFTTVYALGNRVWYDTNNSALIDNGEGANASGKVGVDGVLLQLYAENGSGTFVDTGRTATTANGGYYLFDGLESGSYRVVIPASNFAAGAPLNGYWSSQTMRATNGDVTETLAASPETGQDSDDNGTRQSGGAVESQTVVLGPGSVEPVNELDTDALAPGSLHQGNQPDVQANMTVDFGFYSIQIGDLVWNDMDNTGNVDGSDTAMPGVDVQLWSVNTSTGQPAALLTTDTTDAGGLYSFSGLPQGDYILRIPRAEFEGTETLRDYKSSTGLLPASAYEPAPDADTNTTDSDDNGTETGGMLGLGGYIQSEIVTLTPAGEQSYNNDNGTTAEPRVDFGVYLYRLADLSITKTDGQDSYIYGETLQYQITVRNDGPADMPDAHIEDLLPRVGGVSQFVSWEWSCIGTTGAASGCDPMPSAAADFADDLNLPSGSSVTYEVTAVVGTVAANELVNTVTLSSATVQDSTPATPLTATDTDKLAALLVSKSDNVSVVAPGSTLTYTIQVENYGAVDLTAVRITDTLPADVTFVSASLAPDDITGNVLTWNGLSLNIGDTLSITLEVRVSDTPANPTITNTVEVLDVITGSSATAEDTDTIAVTNAKTIISTNINSDAAPKVLIGEVVTYQISLTLPPGTLGNLKALDELEEGLAFDECLGVLVSDPGAVSTTLAGGLVDACPAATGDPDVTDSGHQALFDFGTVTNSSATDQVLTVQYLVDVLDVAVNVNGVNDLNNKVTWTWDGGSLEASAPALEIFEPDMTILKNASPSVALLGSTITFTIDIEHTDISTADAYDVVVTDQLPSGLQYVGNVATTGLAYDRFNYDTTTSTITFEWDVFPLLATSSITFEATFVGPPPVINEASVAWTSIPLDPGMQSNYNPNSTERFYDPLDPAGVNDYGVMSSATINIPRLPKTGFAPSKMTTLPVQPKEMEYLQLDALTLEIPRLSIKLPIVGIPTSAQGWDLTWLSNQAGWLEGTAYPTLAGNTGITAHAYLADGTPGPFVNLGSLYWGDKVYVHANGNKYTYEVREVHLLWPADVSVLRHEEFDWITLITCREYNEKLKDYTYRLAVRAVLIQVEPE